jgi:Fe-S cluster assembly protein SufD
VDADNLLDGVQQNRLQRCDSVMLVLVNGYFMPLLSDLNKLPEGVIACSMRDSAHQHLDLIKTHLKENIDADLYPFASLNASQLTDGLFLYLPDDMDMPLPVHLVSIVTGTEEFLAHPRHIFILGKNSKLVFLEEHYSHTDLSYMMNIVTSLVVEENAKLEYYKLQCEGKNAVHMAHTFIRQKQNSSVSFTDFATGGTFARDEIVVKLQEPGAECRTGGFYRLHDDNQYIDHHIDIDHLAPRSNSEMLYKGILDNKSRAVFNGRLHVEQNAQKILAYQANHNLLLSNNAEVYSKPELEIYADDVKCKHGATTGQLDQDALFYMRSRGIEYAEAMNILLKGFAEEVLQRVTHPGIKLRLQELL